MQDNRRVFITFFPECENIHLTKDVGMIPFILHRNLKYESYIVCYKNGDYPHLEREVKGLKLIFLKKHALFPNIPLIRSIRVANSRLVAEFELIMDAFVFFAKHRNCIDVLQMYHITFRSLLIAFIFRLTNKKGIIYLKLDMNPDIIDEWRMYPRKKFFQNAIKLVFAKFIPLDIISAETKILFQFLVEEHRLYKKLKNNTLYIPNGVDVKNITVFRLLKEGRKKDNIILHIGRIGAYEKGSEIILEAFSLVSHSFPEWRLILFGSIEPGFEKLLKVYLESSNNRNGNILYLGFLPTYEDVLRYYVKAKILAIPSRSESFGLSLIEAGLYGDVILGSDIPSFKEITQNGRYGYLCQVDDILCFETKLEYILSHQNEMEIRSSSFQEFIRNNYDWNKICDKIDQKIRQISE